MHLQWHGVMFLSLLAVGCLGNTPAKINKQKTASTVHTSAGQQAMLKCFYDGIPRPQAIWMREGKQLLECKNCVTHIDNTKHGVTTLRVTPYRESDYGDYICKVRNENGFDSVTITLVEQPAVMSQCNKDLVLGADPRLRLEFRPRCDPNGAYHRVQCSIHLDKCWCVDTETGHKIADAYKADGGMHCNAPKDFSISAAVVISMAALLLVVAMDMVAFVCCKRGLVHSIVKYKEKRSVYGKWILAHLNFYGSFATCPLGIMGG
ncbi:predicted protein [Nematostella vectensis]|uniref:Ig-like domain-containing protein n=1 Tax=Nematostella vectensis TaxID=45351 RepID=A7RYF5_NEMVE|nr:uncharacterized protein LOC5515400 isoform X2 [Nematostella vectensis]EDO43452.1 predicted protein [Nematostella vectensis]|eukprot:XP_001635515.1 predicted protein [Nematostella vectensis]